MTDERSAAQQKTDELVEECRSTGEPFFVFVAHDDLGIQLLEQYRSSAEQSGTPPERVELMHAAYLELADWRLEHPELCHLPGQPDVQAFPPSPAEES